MYITCNSPGTVKYFKACNIRNIMQCLLVNDRLTKLALVEATGLSNSTISECVNRLYKLGIVEVLCIDKPRGGRPPALYRIRRNYGVFISIMIREEKLHAAAIDMLGDMIQYKECQRNPAEAVLVQIYSLIELVESKLKGASILAYGISTDGKINAIDGIVISNDAIFWYNVHIKEIMERHFGIYTFVDHFANAGALYHRLLGEAKLLHHFLCVFAECPSKAAIILEGRVFYGHEDLSKDVANVAISPGEITAFSRILPVDAIITDRIEIQSDLLIHVEASDSFFARATALMAEYSWFFKIYDILR